MSTSRDPANRRPNLLVVMSDQHHAGYLGGAGHPHVRTPNMDALAARGVRFDQAYTAAPICGPARMSFMTCRMPSALQCWTNTCVLSSWIPTFAHSLGAAGYETVLSGKMHFVGHDQYHGFEKRLCGEQLNGLIPESLYRSPKGGTWTGTGAYPVIASGPGYQAFQLMDRVYTDHACDYIRSRDHDDGRPWAMVVGMICPHNPYVCEPELHEHYRQVVPPPELPTAEQVRQFPSHLRRLYEANEMHLPSREDHHRALAAYHGLVTEVDRQLGRLLDALRDSGQLENTVVIYTSDHGDMATEWGLWYKSNFTDPAARVPLIVSWPRAFRQHVSSDAVVSLLDLGATLLDLADADPLPEQDGRSLRPLLCGSPAAQHWPNEAFAEERGMGGGPPSFMIRRGRYKFTMFGSDEERWLVDMVEDPGERRNLADEPDYQTLAQALSVEALARWSPRFVLDRLQRNRAMKRVIDRCGHSTLPTLPDDLPVCEGPPGFHRFEMPEGWRERLGVD